MIRKMWWLWSINFLPICFSLTRNSFDKFDTRSLVSEDPQDFLSIAARQITKSYEAKLHPQSSKVIFTCTRAELCGGLGDRFKGFVSTFVLAVLLNARFVVLWDTPDPINNFYHMSAQSLRDEDLGSCQNRTNWSWLNEHTDLEKLTFLRNTDFAKLWSSSDCINVHLNGAVWNHFIMNTYFAPTSALYDLHRFSKREVFQLVMDLHFWRPRPALSALVWEIGSSLNNGKHVGVQMRLGGRWGDPVRYGGNLDKIVGCFVQESIRMCGTLESAGDCSIFLTSDSPTSSALFKEQMQLQGVQVITTPGESVHIERHHDTVSLEDQVNTFAVWEMLKRMNLLVISRSGFGETASWAGNVPAATLKSATGACTFTSEGVDIPEGADPHYPD